MSNRMYILGGEDGHTVIQVHNLIGWGEWLEQNKDMCAVAVHHMVDPGYRGGFIAQTEFIGLDMEIYLLAGKVPDEVPPSCFETRVWRVEDGKIKMFQEEHNERYSTWDDAVAGHYRALAKYFS